MYATSSVTSGSTCATKVSCSSGGRTVVVGTAGSTVVVGAAVVVGGDVVDVGVEAAFDAYVARDDRPQPSHLFSSTEALYAAADGQGVAPRQMFRYRADDSFPPSAREIEGMASDDRTQENSSQTWSGFDRQNEMA